MKNLRDYFKVPEPYYSYNREERNWAAILYHFLLDTSNLAKFLSLLDVYVYDINKVEVYYEFAMIRDLWNYSGETNDKKRKFILGNLDMHDPAMDSIVDFNNFFGSRINSISNILSPANWSVNKFDKRLKNDKNLFEKTCNLKWCFNIKPDIVILLNESTAISIETKFASNEGTYSAKRTDNETYKSNQLEIQRMMMKEILGYKELTQIYIVKNFRNPKPVKTLTWQEVFNSFELKDSSNFIRSWPLITKNNSCKKLPNVL